MFDIGDIILAIMNMPTFDLATYLIGSFFMTVAFLWVFDKQNKWRAEQERKKIERRKQN